MLPENTAFFKQGYKVANGEAIFDVIDGYTGCSDTYLMGNWGEGGQHVGPYLLNSGGSPTMNFSGVPWGGEKSAGLIRFDDIFGTAEDQVDPDAEILSATLRIHPYAVLCLGDYSYLTFWPMETPWVEGNGTSTKDPGSSTYSYREYRTDGDYGNHPGKHLGLRRSGASGPGGLDGRDRSELARPGCA